MTRLNLSTLALATFAKDDARGTEVFQLKSKDLFDGKRIAMKHVYNAFGCVGENLSPELSWDNPPTGTKSFAILAHDPDAPTGGAGFWHWIVVDIPADIRNLKQNAGAASGKHLPIGAQMLETDFAEKAYGGPCPPPGAPHQYVFTIYALKIDKLGDAVLGRTAIAGFTIEQNALAKASLTGFFGR